MGQDVRGNIDLAFSGGYSLLVLEGWLAAARPVIQRVWLKDASGAVAAVSFKWRRKKRPDVTEAMKGQLPKGYTATGYILLIETPGGALPMQLQIELQDGARWSINLSGHAFVRMTETYRRQWLEDFGGSSHRPVEDNKPSTIDKKGSRRIDRPRTATRKKAR